METVTAAKTKPIVEEMESGKPARIGRRSGVL